MDKHILQGSCKLPAYRNRFNPFRASSLLRKSQGKKPCRGYDTPSKRRLIYTVALRLQLAGL